MKRIPGDIVDDPNSDDKPSWQDMEFVFVPDISLGRVMFQDFIGPPTLNQWVEMKMARHVAETGEPLFDDNTRS